VVDSTKEVVGLDLASFLIAAISGVFPLVNAELYLIGLVVESQLAWLTLIVLGVILAFGQMVTTHCCSSERAGPRRPAAGARRWRCGSRERRHGSPRGGTSGSRC